MVTDKLKQIRLITGYVTGMIVGEFWYEYESTSFLFTTSFRQGSIAFIFTKTINERLYKVTKIYPFNLVFTGKITKEKIAREMYLQIIKEIPEFERRKLPVIDPHYIPGKSRNWNN